MARPTGSQKFVKTNFAKNFSKLMEENNISSYKLAKATGYSEGCFSRIKSQCHEPSVGLLIAVANFFNVTTDSLLK
jgi:hypothetical protein